MASIVMQFKISKKNRAIAKLERNSSEWKMPKKVHCLQYRRRKKKKKLTAQKSITTHLKVDLGFDTPRLLDTSIK